MLKPDYHNKGVSVNNTSGVTLRLEKFCTTSDNVDEDQASRPLWPGKYFGLEKKTFKNKGKDT
ncbi:hypothetical protein E2C01_041422 [Portunus trituberculatus]|uniref:Uncharacterized protein n=1 Tax=Portunus trituberculatus TaxID=210409 RepID=A0A5B7FQX0_PORTR|nr:hypothetical protein [Portunus trituberculatus]